jgi:hypothetical protein
MPSTITRIPERRTGRARFDGRQQARFAPGGGVEKAEIVAEEEFQTLCSAEDLVDNRSWIGIAVVNRSDGPAICSASPMSRLQSENKDMAARSRRKPNAYLMHAFGITPDDCRVIINDLLNTDSSDDSESFTSLAAAGKTIGTALAGNRSILSMIL